MNAHPGHYRRSPLSCSFGAALAACKLRYSRFVASWSSAAVLDRSCCCWLARRGLARSRSVMSLRSLLQTQSGSFARDADILSPLTNDGLDVLNARLKARAHFPVLFLVCCRDVLGADQRDR